MEKELSVNKKTSNYGGFNFLSIPDPTYKPYPAETKYCLD